MTPAQKQDLLARIALMKMCGKSGMKIARQLVKALAVEKFESLSYCVVCGAMCHSCSSTLRSQRYALCCMECKAIWYDWNYDPVMELPEDYLEKEALA